LQARMLGLVAHGMRGFDMEAARAAFQVPEVYELDAIIAVGHPGEVAALPDVVRQNGMTWFHFPVEDDAAPAEAFEQSWQASKPEVLALIEQGKCVAIHCRGGSGRTAFMAAVIMQELGMGEAQATDLVKGLRPNSLKLPAHTEFLAAHYDIKTKEETVKPDFDTSTNIFRDRS
ncbi:MAG: hypothetical protein R3260_18805, partial [Pseudomonas sp.]|nr:hypothetical protein [Pseudomonas sp.]